jgi:hypothetical protein
MSSARWMAVALYALRLALFSKQLSIPKTKINAILHLVIFVIKVYVQVWFSAPLGVAAPRNDLDTLKMLIEYKKVNKSVASAATTRLVYHLWYLSEIMIGISVFDEGLSASERQKIVQNMSTKEGAEDPSRKRDEIQLSDVPKMSVSDLVTKNSLKFFEILGLQTDFFKYPVSEWASRDDYQEGRQISTHLRVVNDTAERGVKLFKNFNRALTKKESCFQDLVVSVDQHRKSRPDFKKSTLVNKYEK